MYCYVGSHVVAHEQVFHLGYSAQIHACHDCFMHGHVQWNGSGDAIVAWPWVNMTHEKQPRVALDFQRTNTARKYVQRDYAIAWQKEDTIPAYPFFSGYLRDDYQKRTIVVNLLRMLGRITNPPETMNHCLYSHTMAERVRDRIALPLRSQFRSDLANVKMWPCGATDKTVFMVDPCRRQWEDADWLFHGPMPEHGMTADLSTGQIAWCDCHADDLRHIERTLHQTETTSIIQTYGKGE